MPRFMSSIRSKITFGYYAIVAVIIGLSVFTFIELRYMEQKILLGESISEFFDTTLEIRRFEKNFFLYESEYDYRENAEYIKKARMLLDSTEKEFLSVSNAGRIERLKNALVKYEELMAEYSRLIKQNRVGMARVEQEGRIRQIGKDIITAAEDISITERRSLQAALTRSRHLLIISILSLSGLAIVIGQVLSRMVVRPLKALEESMGIIAEGRFERVTIDSNDREIVSLTTAFNKMLKELELHERHLIQSEKLASLGTLLSGVAHELNNPLSNVSSSAQILSEELEDLGSRVKGQEEKERGNIIQPRPASGPLPLDPAFIKELVAQINEQTDRARNIVRSLLEFSRTKEFKKETLVLRRILDETIQFVRGEVPTRVTIELSVPDDLMIYADKQRIQQVFLNLIKNAIEAIGAADGIVFIRAEKCKAVDKAEDGSIGIYNYLKYRGKCTLEDDTVDIEIHDTGPGIPSEILPKIFDPFFTTKDVGKGSGLGLFIVHEIVEEHDGCIAVDSEPGRGTTFIIRLPVK